MSEASKKRKPLPLRDDLLMFSQGMAAAFFDLTAKAFRDKEQFLFDSLGNKIIISRLPNGDRRYSLNDILRIAHALRRANKMTDRQLRLIVLRVDAFKEPVLKHRRRYRKGNYPE
jgi:uncharacterized Ntn-hydrolase superfamily protein